MCGMAVLLFDPSRSPGKPGDWSRTVLRSDIRAADHLAPLLGFFDDDLAPFGGRQRHGLGAERGESRFDGGIVETGVNLRVELRDDVSGVPLGAPIPFRKLAS